jgi:hypothetical protein
MLGWAEDVARRLWRMAEVGGSEVVEEAGYVCVGEKVHDLIEGW